MKVISNCILIPIDGIYEKGAVIGNILFSLTTFIIVYITLRKKIKLKISLISIIMKPILSSIVMVIISLCIYKLLILRNINSNICTINSIIVAIVIYVTCVFVTKMLNKSEILENVENTEKYRIQK